jgi:hypothetical protein
VRPQNLAYYTGKPLWLSILLLLSVSVASQDVREFREYEDSLVAISKEMMNGAQDEVKFNANELFTTVLSEALSLNNSFKYPFDSLKYISILVSPDKRFRIFTWMIPGDDGSYSHFGFIQSFSRRKNDFEVYQLTDLTDKEDDPQTRVLDHKNWYGAVYYQIIFTRDNGNRYYTLLGLDYSNPLVHRKVIEVLTLRSNGMPRFGQSLFRYRQPQQKRVIFQYSALSSMNLRYEKQHYFIRKKKILSQQAKPTYRQKQRPTTLQPQGRISRLFNPGRVSSQKPRAPEGYRISRKAAEMIIFDQLIPMNPSLENQYQFYVPEGNIVSAFIFSQGRWKYLEDIDARNPANRYDNPKRRPKPEKGLGR